MSAEFSKSLRFGKSAETKIARWLMSRGCHLLPVYEISGKEFKGPAVYCSDGSTVIAPDLFVFKNGKACWIEAKHKTGFSLHQLTGRFVTGIDLHHYAEYQRIDALAPWPVWLLFLHDNGIAKDSPPGPSGLFGAPLTRLTKTENHRSSKWGRSGMVYWAVQSLKKLADYPLA